MRRPAVVAGALALALALAGCTAQNSDLLDDYNKGHDSGDYISGDGSVVVLAPENRAEPVAFSGETDAGDAVSSDELAGRVVLLNFWYASCPPCRREAPELEALNQQFQGEDVVVLGVNTQDSAATAQTFAREHGVTYPSVLDAGSNDVLFAFSGDVPPNAVPTTLLLDREGRVAARFSGYLESPSLVADRIEALLAESGTAG